MGYATSSCSIRGSNYNNGPVTENSTAANVCVGGVCGIAGSSVDISNVENRSAGVITLKNTHTTPCVGGVVGWRNNANINNSKNYADIIIEGVNLRAGGFAAIGGIVGNADQSTNSTTISGCECSGSIITKKQASGSSATDLQPASASETATSYIGGIAAYNGTGSGNRTFSGCKFTGNISLYCSARAYVGGIIGSATVCPTGCIVQNANVTNQNANITYIRQSQTTIGGTANAVTTGEGAIGGIVGFIDTDAISGNTFDGSIYTRDVTASLNSDPYALAGGIVGCTGTATDVTISDCKVNGTFRGNQVTNQTAGLFIGSDGTLAKLTLTGCKVQISTTVHYNYSGSSTAIATDAGVTKARCIGGKYSSVTNANFSKNSGIAVASIYD